jgi:hypothetical protein
MRKIALALLLALASVSPSLAAPCGAIPALPDTTRRTEYTGIASQTGPFNVGFQLYGDGTDYGAWLSVWVNGVLKTAVTDYVVTSPSGALGTLCLPITNAQVTFTAPQSGTIEIEGARRPRRASQFSENRGVTAHDFNQVITDMTAQLRERWDRETRLLRTAPGDSLSVLPLASARMNTVLGFDGSGNPMVLTPTPTTLPLGVDANILRTIPASDSIQTSDCGHTLNMTGALGTLTVPAITGFDSACTVNIRNANTTRGQRITGLSNMPATAPCGQQGSATGTQCILYPSQIITIKIVNGAWTITNAAGAWKIQAGITLTFNVDPSVTNGDTLNDGLATGSGGAFQTVQHCIDTVVSSVFLLSTSSATTGTTAIAKCKLAAGTYNEAPIFRDCNGNIYREFRPCQLEGDTTTPTNVVFKGASVGSVFNAFGNQRPWFIKGVACSPTLTTDDCFFADRTSYMDIGSFAVPTAARNIIYARYGSNIEIIAGATISVTANVNSFATAIQGSQILGQGAPGSETGTVSGSTVASAYASVNDQASMVDLQSITWTGTFTGPKAFINAGSSGSADPNTYPASTAVVYATPFVLGEMPLIPNLTILGNRAGGATTPQAMTAAQTQAVIGYPVTLMGSVTNVNCNSLGDNAITLTLSGTKWRPTAFIVYNHGATASLTAAQFGLFSTTGGGGQALIASGTALSAITQSGIDATANSNLYGTVQAVVDYTSVQFRITQVQGASCTVDAYVYGYPIP